MRGQAEFSKGEECRGQEQTHRHVFKLCAVGLEDHHHGPASSSVGGRDSGVPCGLMQEFQEYAEP